MVATLDAAGLIAFSGLERDATQAVTGRIFAQFATEQLALGQDARQRCADDVAYLLEFLRPVLEFGIVQPLVNYLQWLESLMPQPSLAAAHIDASLQYLIDYFSEFLPLLPGALVCGALKAVQQSFLNPQVHTETLEHVAPPAWPQTREFQAALLAGNHHDAVAVMNRSMDKGADLTDFELHVIQPALYDIGEMWHANQVSVAQEHLATAIVHTVMTIGLLRSPHRNLNGKKVLLACVEGNQHAVGLRMVADSFMLAGWEVQYLGANVPTQALMEQLTQWRPDLLGLSVSFASQMAVAKAAIQTMKLRFGANRPAAMIGGLAINRCAPLAVVSGADSHYADAKSAVLNFATPNRAP